MHSWLAPRHSTPPRLISGQRFSYPLVQEQESAVYLQAGHPEKLGRLNSVAAGERTKARFLRWGRGRPSRTAPVLAKDSSKQQLFVAVRKAEVRGCVACGSPVSAHPACRRITSSMLPVVSMCVSCVRHA